MSRTAFLLLSLFVVVALYACGAQADTALTIRVPSKEECLYEAAPPGRVFLHFVVTSGGDHDIDVSIHQFGKLVWQTERSSESRVLFKTTGGDIKVCFSNKMSTITSKTVSFHLMFTASADEENRDPVENTIVNIHNGLTEIANEQKFLQAREMEHRDTAESTHNHILVWSLVEIVIIIGAGVGNVVYLRRLFESRRVV